MTEALVDWEQSGGARPELGPIPEGHPPSPPRLLPASSISRREAVVNQIRRGIMLGVLRPGEKLTEVSLASTLRVSLSNRPGSARSARRRKDC